MASALVTEFQSKRSLSSSQKGEFLGNEKKKKKHQVISFCRPVDLAKNGKQCQVVGEEDYSFCQSVDLPRSSELSGKQCQVGEAPD